MNSINGDYLTAAKAMNEKYGEVYHLLDFGSVIVDGDVTIRSACGWLVLAQHLNGRMRIKVTAAQLRMRSLVWENQQRPDRIRAAKIESILRGEDQGASGDLMITHNHMEWVARVYKFSILAIDAYATDEINPGCGNLLVMLNYYSHWYMAAPVGAVGGIECMFDGVQYSKRAREIFSEYEKIIGISEVNVDLHATPVESSSLDHWVDVSGVIADIDLALAISREEYAREVESMRVRQLEEDERVALAWQAEETARATALAADEEFARSLQDEI
jgi:hypothetical protein